MAIESKYNPVEVVDSYIRHGEYDPEAQESWKEIKEFIRWVSESSKIKYGSHTELVNIINKANKLKGGNDGSK